MSAESATRGLPPVATTNEPGHNKLERNTMYPIQMIGYCLPFDGVQPQSRHLPEVSAHANTTLSLCGRMLDVTGPGIQRAAAEFEVVRLTCASKQCSRPFALPRHCTKYVHHRWWRCEACSSGARRSGPLKGGGTCRYARQEPARV